MDAIIFAQATDEMFSILDAALQKWSTSRRLIRPPFDVLLTHPDKLVHISPPIKTSRPADTLGCRMLFFGSVRRFRHHDLCGVGREVGGLMIMCSCDVALLFLELLTDKSSRCPTRSSRDNPGEFQPSSAAALVNHLPVVRSKL